MAIKTVVFDIGGVFLDWNPRHLYDKLFDDAAERDHFLTHVCNLEWNARQDAGRSFRQAVAEIADAHPTYVRLAELYLERWPEMVSGLIDGTMAIAESLKKSGMPLYLLTNCSAETFPIIQAHFTFPALFDGAVVSGQIGLMKPDPAIYRHLLDRFGLQAADSLFIDDVPANVDAARALGMHAHHFRNAAGLRAELVALGCLPRE
jgi:2-haloacid dehalogenase